MVLNNYISDTGSSNRLNCHLIFLDILQRKQFAQSTKNLVVWKVLDMRRHLVTELDIALNLLS